MSRQLGPTPPELIKEEQDRIKIEKAIAEEVLRLENLKNERLRLRLNNHFHNFDLDNLRCKNCKMSMVEYHSIHPDKQHVCEGLLGDKSCHE